MSIIVWSISIAGWPLNANGQDRDRSAVEDVTSVSDGLLPMDRKRLFAIANDDRLPTWARGLAAQNAVSRLEPFELKRIAALDNASVESVWAAWEILRVSSLAGFLSQSETEVQLNRSHVKSFLDTVERATKCDVPPEWQQILMKAKFNQIGRFDFLPYWSEMPEDEPETKPSHHHKELVVRSDSIMPIGEEDFLFRKIEKLEGLDLAGFVRAGNRGMLTLPSDDASKIRFGIASVRDSPSEISGLIHCDWIRPRTNLLDIYPVVSKTGDVCVFYATLTTAGFAVIDLNAKRVAWDFGVVTPHVSKVDELTFIE
ncbi:MAG: hypothetical protein AAGG48_32195 [Planctomycetota bacterium]